MIENMNWLNEPARWSTTEESLTVHSDHGTDFWRETFHGSTHDSGHFLHRKMKGDFTATVTLSGDFHTLYDQAGLMVRGNERIWMKTGVEYTDQALHLSTVNTNETSDWSVLPLQTAPTEITLQVTRQGETLLSQYLHPHGMIGQWQTLRLTHLPLRESCDVGLMMCSPKRGDLCVTFRDFTITPAHPIDLHPEEPT